MNGGPEKWLAYGEVSSHLGPSPAFWFPVLESTTPTGEVAVSVGMSGHLHI